MRRDADIPELLLLAPWYRLVEDGETVVLEHAHRAVVFEGRAAARLLPRLLPLLDGTRTRAELVAATGPAAAAAVDLALELLAANGLLVAGPPPDGPAEACETAERLAAASGMPPSAVRGRLAAAQVGVAGTGHVADAAARLLHRGGVGLVVRCDLAEPPPGLDAVLVTPAADELAALGGWNERSLAAGLPWLQVLPFDGRLVAIGPLFLPGETACHECYRLRRAASLGFGALDPLLAAAEPRAAAGPALATVAAAVAADDLLRWLGLADPRLPGVLHALTDEGGLRLDAHRVLRVPRCPACSPAARLAPAAPWFEAVA